MNFFFTISGFLMVLFSSCSVCRLREISKEKFDHNSHISYKRINAKCPKGSTVEGYNKQGIVFQVYTSDSSWESNSYIFYLDSERVKKINSNKYGRKYYELDYVNSDSTSMTNIEAHLFKRLTQLSDSLKIKNLSYLQKAKGFKFKSEWKPTKRK
jgi:hypothetical protein